jgi:hypothetical protein
MTEYADIADHDEDARIEIIGHAVMVEQKTCAFIVEDDPAEKAERYIRKLEAKFPGIRVIARGKGPVSGTVFVKVAPPLN